MAVDDPIWRMPVEGDALRLSRARDGEWRRTLIESGGIFLPGPLPDPTDPTDLYPRSALVFAPARAYRSRRARWWARRVPEQRSVLAPPIELLGRTTNRNFHALRVETQVRLGYRECVEYRYPSVFRRPLVTGRPIAWFGQSFGRRQTRRRAWPIERWPNAFFESRFLVKSPARAFFGPAEPRAREPWRSCSWPSVFHHLRLIGEGDSTPFPGEVF